MSDITLSLTYQRALALYQDIIDMVPPGDDEGPLLDLLDDISDAEHEYSQAHWPQAQLDICGPLPEQWHVDLNGLMSTMPAGVVSLCVDTPGELVAVLDDIGIHTFDDVKAAAGHLFRTIEFESRGGW